MMKSKVKLLKQVLISPLAVFIAAPLIIFLPLLVKGQALYWGTPATQFIPWWDFAFSTILQGDLPLWNPWVGMGAPLIANYQSALFYPPYWSLLIVYSLAGITGMAWFISIVVVFHLSWSAAGTGYLLKELGVSKLGQAIGGLAFGLSGYLIARSGFLSINAAVAWLPWILLYSLRLVRGRKNSVILLGVMLAFQLLAGHAQTTWYSLIFVGLWSLFWIWQSKKLTRGDSTWWTAPIKLVISGVTALGLSAIQLIPTMEYLLESQRAGEYGYSQAVTYSFWPWRFLTLFVPNLFGTPAQSNYWGYGNYWEDAVYIGLLPVIFALTCLISGILPIKRKKQPEHEKHIPLIRFLGVVILLSFILALGDNTPIFPFLYRYMPTFNLFQAPTRYSIWAVMSLAVLAGLGVDRIRKPTGKARYWSNLAAAGSIAITLGAGLGYFFFEDIKSTFFLPIGIAGVVSSLGMLLVLFKPGEEEKNNSNIWQTLLILLISADLIIAGWGLNPGVNLNFYQPEKGSMSKSRVWISPEAEYNIKYNNFFNFDSFESSSIISEVFDIPLPNTGIIKQQETVNNFDPLVPRRFQEWMIFSEEFADQSQHPIFDLMDTDLLLTEKGYQGRIGENAVNNRLIIANLEGYAEEAEILRQIGDRETGNRQGLVLEPDQIGLHDCELLGSGTVIILDEWQSALRAEVDLEHSSWLLWSQNWYPGWNLYLDGQHAVPVLRGNYTFMAACIPEGNHILEFKYQPGSIRVGAFITFACLSLMIGISLLNKRSEG